jgi:uncharacterized repeat protein (TIGR01451 family)
LAVDASGNLYVSEVASNRVRKITVVGLISTVAGNGVAGYSGDGGPATGAQLNQPSGLAVDGAGNLFIADGGNHVIRKVAPGGNITTVAGNGTYGDSGEGGPAIKAQLRYPHGVAVDAAGSLYIADRSAALRKVTPQGVIMTVAGTGRWDHLGDDETTTHAEILAVVDVTLDAGGSLFITDEDKYGIYHIRKVTPDGTVTTVAGKGSVTYSADGGAPVYDGVLMPTGIAVGAAGNLYVADVYGQRVLRLVPQGSRAVLNASLRHPGSFVAGRLGATYSVNVRNARMTAATNGAVTVTDIVPKGLSLVSMSGAGWTCSSNSCSRTDALAPGASYPAITVVVNVAADAPVQVTNHASVSGGGSAIVFASDLTSIGVVPR